MMKHCRMCGSWHHRSELKSKLPPCQSLDTSSPSRENLLFSLRFAGWSHRYVMQFLKSRKKRATWFGAHETHTNVKRKNRQTIIPTDRGMS
jgi:hypothetical protein